MISGPIPNPNQSMKRSIQSFHVLPVAKKSLDNKSHVLLMHFVVETGAPLSADHLRLLGERLDM
jgi:hypothetical protein